MYLKKLWWFVWTLCMSTCLFVTKATCNICNTELCERCGIIPNANSENIFWLKNRMYCLIIVNISEWKSKSWTISVLRRYFQWFPRADIWPKQDCTNRQTTWFVETLLTYKFRTYISMWIYNMPYPTDLSKTTPVKF